MEPDDPGITVTRGEGFSITGEFTRSTSSGWGRPLGAAAKAAWTSMAHRELRPDLMRFGAIIGSTHYPELALLVLGRKGPIARMTEHWECLILANTLGDQEWLAGETITVRGDEDGLLWIENVADD